MWQSEGKEMEVGGYSHNKRSILTSSRLSMLQTNQESTGLFFFFEDVFIHPLGNCTTIIYYQKIILLCLSGADLVGARWK